MRKFLTIIAALAVMAIATPVALAFTTPPAMPVEYPCAVEGDNEGVVHAWDDQFFPLADPFCGLPENMPFAVCLATAGFDIWSIDQQYIDYIVGLYTTAGVNATLGNCAFGDREFPMCYGAGANSIYYKARADAVALYADGAKVPVASKTAQTNYVVGNHHLTCAGGTPTGNLVSTGNGGEIMSGVHAGLLKTNPLDWTIEVG